MMLVAIGDIHGEFEKLSDLTRTLHIRHDIDFQRDTFVFLGDYIDGGPASRNVVQTMIDCQQRFPHWQFLMGNHEHMMLDAVLWNSRFYGSYYQWFNQGGRETLRSYGGTIDPAHLEWIELLPYRYETKNFIFVHAGEPVNHGMRRSDDNMMMLWARYEFINSTYDYGKKIIFGHTVKEDLQPWIFPNKIGIDTMHHGHGHITAVILDDERPDYYEFVTSED